MAREIYIKLEEPKTKDNPNGHIALDRLASVFEGIQKSIYVLGGRVLGESASSTGRFSKRVEDYCRLVIHGANIGSLEISASIPYPQTSLDEIGLKPGEPALDKFADVLSAIETDDPKHTIEELIPEQDYRDRLLKHIDSVWPSLSDNPELQANVIIGFNKKRPRVLDPHKKKIISELYLGVPEEKDIHVYGAISEARVMGKTRFKIRTPTGEVTCNYRPSMWNLVKDYLKRGVIVHGVGPGNQGAIKEISDVHSLRPLNETEWNEFTHENTRYIFSKPLVIDVDFKEDWWFYSVPEYNIQVTNQDIAECEDEMRGYLDYLYTRFVVNPEPKMNKKAKDLQKKLRTLIKKREIGEL